MTAKQQAMKDILKYVKEQKLPLSKRPDWDTWIVSVSHFKLNFKFNQLNHGKY